MRWGGCGHHLSSLDCRRVAHDPRVAGCLGIWAAVSRHSRELVWNSGAHGWAVGLLTGFEDGLKKSSKTCYQTTHPFSGLAYHYDQRCQTAGCRRYGHDTGRNRRRHLVRLESRAHPTAKAGSSEQLTGQELRHLRGSDCDVLAKKSYLSHSRIEARAPTTCDQCDSVQVSS